MILRNVLIIVVIALCSVLTYMTFTKSKDYEQYNRQKETITKLNFIVDSLNTINTNLITKSDSLTKLSTTLQHTSDSLNKSLMIEQTKFNKLRSDIKSYTTSEDYSIIKQYLTDYKL